jgi:hypothetical protein
VLLVNPIHAKDASVVGVFFLSDAIILDSIMQGQLPVGSSSQDISALGTVLELVNKALVRLVGLFKRIGRSVVELESHLIATQR